MKRFSLLLLSIFAATAPFPLFAKMSNDPFLLDEWHLGAIRAYDAWDSTTGSKDVIVAVLDTGIDLDHPDLVQNIWTNPGEIAGDGIDNDGNGYVDDVHGWDFVEDDNTPEPDVDEAVSLDAIAHGTIIAGAIAAVGNNAEGVAGISWNSRILPVRILDNTGSGETWRARRAIRYAITSGADVINLSFTGFEYDADFAAAVKEAYEAGVVVVAALGNASGGGVDVNQTPIYPACFTGPGEEDYVLGVVASDKKDTKASFSNFGSNCADISAPGVDIFGTVFQDEDFTEIRRPYGGGYSGTSLATPMVSGVVALVKSAFPSLTPKDIKTILQLSVDPVFSGTAPKGSVGAGRLQAARALAIAPSFVHTPVPHVPSPEPTPEEPPLTTVPKTASLVFGASKGEEPWVQVFGEDGSQKTRFLAYAEAFRGGVRVALGDVDADGTPEIITAPGPGGGPHIRVFTLDGVLKGQFFAGNATDHTGWFVAIGDTHPTDGAEILIGEDAGGSGEVRVYSHLGVLQDVYSPYGQTSAAVRVASGALFGGVHDDVVVSRGNGFTGSVIVFEAQGERRTSFDAYAPTYTRGVFVSVGDVTGDGIDDIVTGTDEGGGPHVRVFSASGDVLGSFFAYDTAFRGGVRVSVLPASTKGPQIVTVPGPGGGPHVRIFTMGGAVTGQFFLPVAAGGYGRFVAAADHSFISR